MFKVGDRVKCIKLGIGVVINVFDGDAVYVKFEGHNPLYYLKNGKAYGLADDFDITPIEKEKEQVVKTGDKARLKKEFYKEKAFTTLPRHQRVSIAGQKGLVLDILGNAGFNRMSYESENTGSYTIPISLLELVKEPKLVKHEWTKAEIDEANRIVGEILISATNDRTGVRMNTDDYAKDHIVRVQLYHGKEHTSKPIATDTPNLSIGLCVALCKATGREIPKFIKGDRK